MEKLKNQLRFLLMPGADLMTRRRVRLSKKWMKGKRRFLDAGSGNGWFSYLAYRSGASVIAVNMEKDQVAKAVTFYNGFKNAPEEALKFINGNLYDLERLVGAGFDEIICFETLEHIKNDAAVCAAFYRLLKPGGVLHLCCPNAEHPRWKAEPLDFEEKGYHVRAGYTTTSYKELLEPIGFKIAEMEGVGGPVLTAADHFFEKLRPILGDALCLPFVYAAIPLVEFDSRKVEGALSIYVKAQK